MPDPLPTRHRMLTWAAALIAAFAFVMQAYCTQNRLGLFTADGNFELVDFGWPLPFVRAKVDYAAFGPGSRTFFDTLRGAVDPEFQLLNCLIDVCICAVLAASAAFVVNWVCRKFQPRFSLNVLLGLTAFACIEAFVRWRAFFPGGNGLQPIEMVEFVALTYSQKFTWFCVFLACLVVPHVVGRVLSQLTRK